MTSFISGIAAGLAIGTALAYLHRWFTQPMYSTDPESDKAISAMPSQQQNDRNSCFQQLRSVDPKGSTTALPEAVYGWATVAWSNGSDIGREDGDFCKLTHETEHDYYGYWITSAFKVRMENVQFPKITTHLASPTEIVQARKVEDAFLLRLYPALREVDRKV